MKPSTNMTLDLARMRAEFRSIRYELAARKFVNALNADALLRAKFNANQPRVPPGNPTGGQWTSGGGGGGVDASEPQSVEAFLAGFRESLAASGETLDDHSAGRAQLDDAQPETGTTAGEAPDGTPVEEANSRRGGTGNQRFLAEATPGQLARFEASRIATETEIARVRELNPAYEPRPTLSSPRNVEEAIRGNEYEARAARDEIQRLMSLARDTNGNAGYRYDEMRAALRLERDIGMELTRSNRLGEDFVDRAGRGWDLIGSNARERYFNYESFTGSLNRKLNGSVDRIGLDISVMGPENALQIIRFIESLPSWQARRIHIIRSR